jgi:hypothetical protein
VTTRRGDAERGGRGGRGGCLRRQTSEGRIGALVQAHAPGILLAMPSQAFLRHPCPLSHACHTALMYAREHTTSLPARQGARGRRASVRAGRGAPRKVERRGRNNERPARLGAPRGALVVSAPLPAHQMAPVRSKSRQRISVSITLNRRQTACSRVYQCA